MIELITFHRSTNYGALLQSLSLKEFIEEKLKKKVLMAKYHPNKLLYAEFVRPLITKKLTKLEQTLKKNINIYRWKKKAFLNSNSNLNNEHKLNIYGSDEIWNFNNPYHGFDPFFFGKNRNGKKISYAASIGKSDISLLEKNEDLKIKITNLLEDFDKISVRDENTFKFIKYLTKKEPEIVLDPTLIYTPKILENEKFIKFRPRKNYCLVYGTVFSKEQQNLIYDFCKKRNLDIISVGYFNHWVEKNLLELNPTNFIYYIKNSSFIFTSMFHGVMFSTKYSKQFLFSLDPIRKNKIESFLNLFDLRDRVFTNNTQVQDIDYEKLKKKLQPIIEKSQKFLIDNIN